MKNKLIPEIRFERFTDDWEQRKLGETLALLKDGTHGTHTDVGEGIYLLSAKNIKNGQINIDESDRIISEDEYKSIHKNFNLEKGDVLLTIVGSIGEVAILENPSKLTFQRSVAYLRPDGTLTSQFLYTTIMSAKFQRELKKRQVVSAQPGIYLGDLSVIPIELPCMEEQKKIGAFFKQLDDSITLQQRKLELLKDQKKSFLQRMFPKNESNKPEIRFAGFTDDWEQRKVGEFLEESKIPGSDGSIAKKLTVKLWGKGVIPKEEIYKGSASTNYYIRKQGQFIYGKLDFLNQAFGIIPKELDGYESTLDSPAFDILQGLNAKYFLEYVSRKEFYLFQGTIANGSRRAKRIHSDTFFNMPIVLPSIEEQVKIGKFFDTLDHTIALQQHKLDLLKEIKKGYLQKMFA